MSHSTSAYSAGDPDQATTPPSTCLDHAVLNSIRHILPLLVGSIAISAEAGGQERDALYLSGRVVTEAGAPIAGARLVIAALPGSEVARVLSSDSTGQFHVSIGKVSRGVEITASHPGYLPATRRFRTVGDQGRVELALTPAGRRLPTVRVQAMRRIPSVAQELGFEGVPSGGADIELGEGNFGRAGELAELLGESAGIAPVPSGGLGPTRFAVLGADGSENRTMVNGLSVVTSALPVRIASASRLVLNSPDPAIGGFAGGLVSASILPGGAFRTGAVSATLGERLSQGVNWGALNAGGFDRRAVLDLDQGGPLGSGAKYRYNVGLQLAKEATSDARVQLPPALRQRIDSTAATLSLLGVPRSGHQAPRAMTGALAGRLDLAASERRSASLTFTASRTERPSTLRSPADLRSDAPAAVSLTSGVVASLVQSIGGPWIGTLRVGASEYARRIEPSHIGPAGAVLRSYSLADGDSSDAWFPFGASAINGRQQSRLHSATVELLRATPQSRHRLRTTVTLEHDASSRRQATDSPGRFLYGSLEDLSANRPIEYVRVLQSPTQRLTTKRGSIALGDVWRPTRNVLVQGGVRADWGTTGSLGLFEPTEHGFAPFKARFTAWSPRLGIQWAIGRERGTAVRARPRWTMRVVVGRFVSPPQTAAYIDYAATTIPFVRVRCEGAATPIPDWRLLSSGGDAPLTCNGNAVFADSAPREFGLVGRFALPRSDRATWGAEGRLGPIVLDLEATESGGARQPGILDANFVGDPAFTLGAEDGRPVFVPPSAIDPQSGRTTGRVARLVPNRGALIGVRHDLRSRAIMLATSLRPNVTYRRRASWRLDYAYAQGQDQQRGLVGSTGGDPRAAEWAPLRIPKHTLAGMVQWAFSGSWAAIAQVTWRSGRPFTPVVDGDINGDGSSENDRPYIPDLRVLGPIALTSLDQVGRRCVMHLAGRIAPRNSCIGPATVSSFFAITYTLPTRGTLAGAQAYVQLEDIGATLDLVLHGQSALRGWEAHGDVDPVLLVAKRFDPTSRRFGYAMNSKFGQIATPRAGGSRGGRLFVGLTLPTAATPARQSFDQMVAGARAPRTGSSTSLPAVRSAAPNPFPTLLAARDSLLLDDEQFHVLMDASREYREQLDASSRAVATLIEQSAPREMLLAAARKKVGDDFVALRDALEVLRSTLDVVQLEQLPREVRQLLDHWTLEALKRSAMRSFR